jgi:hypothetical protein
MMNLNINNENLKSLVFTFSKPIKKENISFDFVTMTKVDSERSFMFDIDGHNVDDNKVICKIYDIAQMIEEYGIENMDSKFDLTLDDLFNSNVKIEAFVEFDEDFELIEAKLGVINNDAEIDLVVIPE